MKRGFMLLGSLVLFLLTASLPAISSAQTAPELFISWKADTYVPSDAPVKALPSRSSVITASVEALERGRPVDLSKTEVRWYAGDRFLTSGVGLTGTSFLADQGRAVLELRVVLKKLRGADLSKTITIPVSQPLLVIDAPYVGRIASATNLEVVARPYYFNFSDPAQLTINWQVNGVKLPNLSDPMRASLNLEGIDPGQQVILRATASDRISLLSTANTSLILTIK